MAAEAAATTEADFAAASARLDAWLATGRSADPVTLALAQALRRRGAAQDADVQAWLAPRLAQAVAQFDAAPRVPPATGPAPASLAPLLAVLPVRAGSELAAAERLRPTLARWRIAGQLARARQRQPENPGPLNSEHLLLRTLQRLQADAPALLGAVVGQVETLLWLDGARGAGAGRGTGRR